MRRCQLLAACVLAGCGGSAAPPAAPDPAVVRAAAELNRDFGAVTDLHLTQVSRAGWARLETSDADAAVFGTFALYVPRDDASREELLQDKTRRTVALRVPADTAFAHGVLLSRPNGSGPVDEVFARVLRAAIAGRPELVPAAERPCPRSVLDPTAAGTNGTCLDRDRSPLVVARSVKVRGARISIGRVAVTPARARAPRLENSPRPRARGRYVVVRARLTGAPLADGSEPRLLVDGRRFPPAPVFTRGTLEGVTKGYVANDAVLLVYDLPADLAPGARTRGVLDFAANPSFGSPNQRLRLAGAPRLPLKG